MGKRDDLADAFALPPPKKRPAIPESQVRAFVEPKRGPARPSSARTRRDGGDFERFNAYVPVELMTRVRERAFRERRSVSDVLTEALERWVAL